LASSARNWKLKLFAWILGGGHRDREGEWTGSLSTYENVVIRERVKDPSARLIIPASDIILIKGLDFLMEGAGVNLYLCAVLQ